MKNTLLSLFICCASIVNAQLVGKSLVVPEFGNGTIKTYFPTSATAIAANPAFTINLNTLPNGLATAGSPNCVAMVNNDLYVSITSANQRIYKFPNYGVNPAAAIANVSQVTNVGNDYVGIAFDTAGNLYVSEGSYLDTNIVKYTAASNYATRIDLGNGGLTSYFADITFDSAGNLWATDYLNNRVVAIKPQDLGTATASFHSLNTNSTTWDTNGGTNGNLTGVLNIKQINLVFSQPEGIAIDSSHNIWVANNNDGSSGALTNEAGTLVRISVGMQATVLANTNTTAIPNLSNSSNGFRIFNMPSSGSGRSQFGGMQIDQALDRIYVNEQVSGSGMWFNIASIASTTDNFNTYKLQITSTNPGNGGIFLASGTQILGINNSETSNAAITVYPNPSNGKFTISTDKSIRQITAFDVLGRAIKVNNLLDNSFELNNASSGNYFLKIEFESGIIAFNKIIIK